MAKSCTRTTGGLVKLKRVVETTDSTHGRKSFPGEIKLAEDVKKGNFAVIAADHDVPKRYILPLSYLTQPSFVRLLEMAAEEYGFGRDGALTVPCHPGNLEQILAEEGGFRQPLRYW